MSKQLKDKSRRSFLQQFAFLAAAFPIVNLSCRETKTVQTLAQSSCEWCGSSDAPRDVSWKAVFADEREPGEPLVISGTVFKEDGKTPAQGILIYAYHTNAQGYYKTKPEEHAHGRLRGWMKTDASGRYEFRTIKPAPYPNQRTDPAHIHLTISGENLPEYWIDSIWFEGDPLITEETRRKHLTGRGGFNPIVKLEKDASNIWRGTFNIKIQRGLK